jgi:tRNA modification GTPase
VTDTDTIAAIATAPGRAGVGIVRLSGPEAIAIARRLFRGGTSALELESHRAYYGAVRDPETDGTLDSGLLLVFRAPRSYTGEDVAEIQVHGSPVALAEILTAALARGARLAEAGEFTRRAFLNGRLDLAQAEAVADLIAAETAGAAGIAARQVEGRLSRELRDLRASVIALLAAIEASVDFMEEVEEPDDLAPRIAGIVARVDRLLATADTGRLYREGAALVIAGRPNVGKSSLLNRLLGEERAIVSPIAGTTRDTIEEGLSLAGIPIRAIDTAGVRETDDPVERLGVERSRRAIAGADLALLVIEAPRGWTSQDTVLAGELPPARTITVANKMDLGGSVPGDDVVPPAWRGRPRVAVSAVDGSGFEGLEAAIADALGGAVPPEAVVVSNVRHIARLQACHAALVDAESSARSRVPVDLVAVPLKAAAESLGAITGETVTEETITQIFARFCVGK